MTKPTKFLSSTLYKKNHLIKNLDCTMCTNPISASKISLSGVPFERKLLKSMLSKNTGV